MDDPASVRVRERVGDLRAVANDRFNGQSAVADQLCASGCPSTYSIAMNARPSTSPTS